MAASTAPRQLSSNCCRLSEPQAGWVGVVPDQPKGVGVGGGAAQHDAQAAGRLSIQDNFLRQQPPFSAAAQPFQSSRIADRRGWKTSSK